MLLLTQAADFLELQTANAVSTDWTCSWVDLNYSASGLVPGSTQGNVATPLSTKIAPAPPAGFQRQIKYLSVVNKDLTLTQTIIVDKNSGAAVAITGAIPLAPGETLQYVDSRGFFVLNAQGFEKFIGATGPTGTPGATGPPGFGPPGTDGEAGEDGVSIPGVPGAAGSPGAPGPFGYLMLIDGEQGEEGMHVPGPQGVQGPQGTPGSAGSGGASGFEILYQEITAEEQWPQGQNTPAAAIASAAVALPGTIADLVMWWESDNILAAAGAPIVRLQERTPWITGLAATNINVGGSGSVAATLDATPINSLPVLRATNAATGVYTLATPFCLNGAATIFCVARPNAATAGAGNVLLGGNTSSLAFYLDSNAGKVELVKTGVGLIGAATTGWTSGVAFQANATYNATTGAWAIRQARATNGSGVSTTGAGTGSTVWLGADNTSSGSFINNWTLAAVIVYNRVLSAPEIASVEAYLLAKWGV